jgi:hypothetical protein
MSVCRHCHASQCAHDRLPTDIEARVDDHWDASKRLNSLINSWKSGCATDARSEGAPSSPRGRRSANYSVEIVAALSGSSAPGTGGGAPASRRYIA